MLPVPTLDVNPMLLEKLKDGPLRDRERKRKRKRKGKRVSEKKYREVEERHHQMLLTQIMVCKMILKGHITFDLSSVAPKME